MTCRTNSTIRAKNPRFAPAEPEPAARSGRPDVALADSLTQVPSSSGRFARPFWAGIRTDPEDGPGSRPHHAGADLAGQEGLEPTTAGFGDRCATNCATALRRTTHQNPGRPWARRSMVESTDDECTC